MEIVIDRLAYEKIQIWIHMTDKEISGFGIVEIVNKVAFVKDVILLDQENHDIETEMKGNDICKAMTEFIQNGETAEMKFWWHSHVDMSCHWSPQDMETIKMLGKQGWFFHSVFNKDGESKTAFSDYSIGNNEELGLDYGIFKDDIDLTIDSDLTQEFFDKCEAEYKQKVKEIVYKPIKPTNEVEQMRKHMNQVEDRGFEYGNQGKKYWNNYDPNTEFNCLACEHSWIGFDDSTICPQCKSELIFADDEIIDYIANDL